MAERLDVKWIHGSPSCETNTDPPIQVFRYDRDTYILRQSKCSHPEGPFMYLLLGETRALLLDTGAMPVVGPPLPVARVVDELLNGWLRERGKSTLELLVAHSHRHSDHAAADGQFKARPRTHVIMPELASVQRFFNLGNWPEGIGTCELGSRALEIIPLPGHEEVHIALYDSRTQVLLTGDTLYPGYLMVYDWPSYRASIARLVEFCRTRPISRILGAHIEMTNRPGEGYRPATSYQPDEHPLELGLEHLLELSRSLEELGARPRQKKHRDFIIQPADAPL